MALGDSIGRVRDERADTLETIFWGAVFLFTLALFYYEFILGVLEPEEAGLFPVSTIVDFKQGLFLTALVGGGSVVALIVYAMFRYSAGVRDRPSPLSPGQGRFKLWVYVLAVLMVVFTTMFVGAATLAQTDEASPVEAAERIGASQRLDMDVQAAQWAWRFDVAGMPMSQAERVVLPSQTLIVFETTSADVIHSFAIKELGITKDAVPGQTNSAWFYVGEVHGEAQIDAAGETVPADTYEVRCAELCGKGHSRMLATIYVVSPDAYETWAHAHGGEAAFEQTGFGGDGHGEEEGGHSEEEGGH